MSDGLHNKLKQLKELLDRERACAVGLDMQGLEKVLQDKMALLKKLPSSPIAADDEAARSLLAQLQDEVRRHTSLYRSARQTILGIRTVQQRCAAEQQGYGPAGGKVAGMAGPLLSGKV